MTTALATKPEPKPAVDRAAPVGYDEIGALLGVKRKTVRQWAFRNLLPEPKWKVNGMPAWRAGDILNWAKKTERLPA